MASSQHRRATGTSADGCNTARGSRAWATTTSAERAEGLTEPQARQRIRELREEIALLTGQPTFETAGRTRRHHAELHAKLAPSNQAPAPVAETTPGRIQANSRWAASAPRSGTEGPGGSLLVGCPPGGREPVLLRTGAPPSPPLGGQQAWLLIGRHSAIGSHGCMSYTSRLCQTC